MLALIKSWKKNLTGHIAVALLAVCALTLAATPVAAQDLQSLLDRIERLERDIKTLNVQIARGSSVASTMADGENAGQASATPVSSTGAAHLDARITTLENDLRSVTGSVEQLGYQINQLSTRIEQLVGDVDYRLSELEGGRVATAPRPAQAQGDGLIKQDGTQKPQPVTAQGSQGSGVLGTITAQQLATAGVADTGDGSSTEVSSSAPSGTALSAEELAAPAPVNDANDQTEVAVLSPQDQYAQAFALLRQAKYDEAAAALQAFVDENGEHELASNARYWLGETYYVRSEFVRAAEVFFEAYRLAPQGPKAPDTLLKLGMALGNLGKTAEACAAFSKLTQEFPNPAPAITSKLERERVNNGCPAG